MLGHLLEGCWEGGERWNDYGHAHAVLRLRHAGQKRLRVRPVCAQDRRFLWNGWVMQQEGVVDAPDVGQQGT